MLLHLLPHYTKLAFTYGDDVQAILKQLCEEAKHYNMATVCVRPDHIPICRQVLGNRTTVKLAGVVGFPEEPVTSAQHAEYPVIGAVASTTKMQEVSSIQMAGGEELDVVMNVAFFKADLDVQGDFTLRELKALRLCAGDMPIKLIIETDLLSDDEIVAATRLAVEAQLDTVKTSTGFIKEGRGAQLQHLRLIRKTLDELGATHIGIKASGGIRTLAQAQACLEAGATRIGTSAGVSIAKAALGEVAVKSTSSNANTY
jgi:deoxyribose-phosphate aldolase